jgi:hypothetical protein
MRWCAYWSRTAGRGGCTPPTTRRSARALDVFERVNQDMPLDGLRIDAPCDPPFRGSHERRDRTTYFQHASAVR